MSGSMAATYRLDVGDKAEAISIAMSRAKARVPRLRDPYVLQTAMIKPELYDEYPVVEFPDFTRTRARRDGR